MPFDAQDLAGIFRALGIAGAGLVVAVGVWLVLVHVTGERASARDQAAARRRHPQAFDAHSRRRR